jgi:hypothetical protein
MSTRCDGCQCVIYGLYFQCDVRKDYDLCEKCFNSMPQAYPMKKAFESATPPIVISEENITQAHLVSTQPYTVATQIVPEGISQPVVPVSHNANCDGCQMRPLVGARYHCTVRDDFDLCSKCEGLFPQPYPMTKIYNPDQSIPSCQKVHPAVCKGCQVDPLLGARFRCTVRDDFDLCSKCEEQFPQPFPMIKVYTYTQAVPKFTVDKVSPTNSDDGSAMIAQTQSPPAPGPKPYKPPRTAISTQVPVPVQYQPAPVYYENPPAAAPAPVYVASQAPRTMIRSEEEYHSPSQSQRNAPKESMANKVLNLHPSVQANALKMGGSMLKLFGNMVTGDDNNNHNNGHYDSHGHYDSNGHYDSYGRYHRNTDEDYY